MLHWKVDITAPQRSKCVICVAPHTSNLDFLLGILAWKSLGREANFLMKSFWFFFPLKYLLYKLGGIPVYRTKGKGGLTSYLVELFARRSHINLAVTPEGTRSANPKWHTGFLYVAWEAKVPVQLGVIDYRSREIIIRDEFRPTGDVEADMRRIKDYYSKYINAAKYPEKFKL